MTGIVLAGGQSRRMGRDKAWIEWEGQPLVARSAGALAAAGCAEVLVVGGDATRIAARGLRAVADAMPGEGPLQALAAALAAATDPIVLVVACDMPGLRPEPLRTLAQLAEGFDAAVPWVPPGGWEPLHAAYAKTCLPAIRARLAVGERKMTCFYPDVRVRAVTPEEVGDLESLRNVNTPAELEAARGGFTIRPARDEADVLAAGHLFDNSPDPAATARFLSEAGHHLLLAFVGAETAGFVSGVEMTHPDKGTEMFLYELGVGPAFQRRGIGRALVEALAGLARSHGCYGMWVLADDDNTAALRTYERAGGHRGQAQRMLTWEW